MISLAVRNLFQNKTRLVISIGGVTLSLVLILTLNAIFAGVEERITAYIDNSGADIFVAQSGVQNMHMATSVIPASAVNQVLAVPGVQGVTPIDYVANMVVVGDDRNLAYVIGLPPAAQLGKPWKVFKGASIPKSGEALIDRYVAENTGIDLGDEVEILGRPFKVAGLTEDTASLVNSFAFVALGDAADPRFSGDSVSFLLVKVDDNATAEGVASRIETEVGGITARPTSEFSRAEKKVVKDMSTDVISIMNLIGTLIGLAVMALTAYNSTLSRRAEYGVLKALGAKNSQLYISVVAQALISVMIGFAVGVLFTWALAVIIPLVGINLTLIISGISLVKVGILSVLIGGISALLPIRQISKLDPVMVFKGN